jgi:hypothetical protein
MVPHSFGVARLPHALCSTMNWPCLAGWMKYGDALPRRWRLPPRAPCRASVSKCFDASMIDEIDVGSGWFVRAG